MSCFVKYKGFVLALLLVAAWAFHFAYPLYYSIALSDIKAEQHKNAESGEYKEIISFTLSNAELRQCLREEGKELDIEGERFDVVSMERTSKGTVCKVISDKRENNLTHTYALSLKHQKQKKTPLLFSFSWYITTIVTSTGQHFTLPTDSRLFFPQTDNMLLKGILGQEPKPPQCFLV